MIGCVGEGREGPALVGKMLVANNCAPMDFFFFFWLFRAAPMAYGSSQARNLVGAIAAGLYLSHNNMESKPCL